MSIQITLAAAEAVVAAARKHAEKIGVPSCIAVVDSGANLVAFVRMDRAWLGSIDIAQDKAFTSRAFDMTTKELARMSQPGEPLFGITASNDGRVVIFAGGVPLKVDGVVIGAVGASGGGPTRITKSPRQAPPRSHPEARPSADPLLHRPTRRLLAPDVSIDSPKRLVPFSISIGERTNCHV